MRSTPRASWQQLGVVSATESGGQLDDAGAVRAKHDLGVCGAVLDAERAGGATGGLGRLSCPAGCRPGVRERHTERGRLGREAIGDRQRMEHAVRREPVDGHLRPLDELFDEARAGARALDRRSDRCFQLFGSAHEREPALALPIWRLQHAWVSDLGRRRPGGRDIHGDRRTRLGDARLGEPLPLPDLGHGEGGGLGRDRVREPEPSCEPGRDRHRPVDSRCHDPIRKLGAGEAVESFLVLGRDDGAAIGVGEAGRRGVAIARDHEEPALAGGGEQPELGGPGAEDKKTGRHGEANVAGAASVAPAATGPTAATIRHIRAAGPTLATGPPASLAPDGMSPKDTAEGGRRREAGPGPRKPTRVEACGRARCATRTGCGTREGVSTAPGTSPRHGGSPPLPA